MDYFQAIPVTWCQMLWSNRSSAKK